jgi:hypothetical protein
MPKERRVHTRTPWVSNINFNYQLMDSVEGPEPKRPLQGQTVDISSDGLCITTTELLPPGAVLTFGTTKLVGVVRWGTPYNKDYKIGIKLV